MTLSLLSSLVLIAVFVAIAWRFGRIWKPEAGDGFESNATIGVTILAVKVVLRSLYWDVVQPVSGDNWIDIRDFLQGQDASTLFNIIGIVGGFFILRAGWWLIPASERDQWKWWNAWLYPPGRPGK